MTESTNTDQSADPFYFVKSRKDCSTCLKHSETGKIE